MASCSRRRTTRPRTAGSSTTRRTAVRPTRTSPSWIQDEANRLLERGLADVETRARSATDTHARLHRCVRRRSGNVIDMDVIRERGRQPRCRSARRSERRRTGRRSPSATASISTVVNDQIDPTFRFVPLDHDGKIRMDCSSPFVMAGLIELRDRFDVAVALRPGRRPARDRHAARRADEPQPLSRDRRSTTCSAARATGRQSTGVGKTLVSSSMIDLVAERPRPTPGRGARRVQVVRRRAARRLARLRRRGERRRVVPPPRRDAVVHRQGRHPARPARRGDHGDDRPRPGRALRRAHGALRRAGLPAHRRAGRRPSARPAARRFEPSDVTATELAGRADPAPCSPRRPATARPSAASRSSPSTAGSRRARPAPRTSTSSTRRA